jgi:putative phage-type endonuclease
MLTSDELKERRRYIGGSDVAAILGLNPYKNVTDVWLHKTGRTITEPTTSRPADLGNRLEPALVELAAETIGDTVELNKRFHNDWRSAQVDGWLPNRQEVVEAKCIGLFNPRFDRNEWGIEGTDEIPFMYLVQVLWQLHVTGANTGHVTALLGGGLGHRMYRIERNDELIKRIDDLVETFWFDNVVADVAPTQPATLATYKEVIREPDRSVEVDSDLPFLYEAAQVAAKEAEVKVDEVKARILQQLGDAEVGVTPFGHFSYRANKLGRRTFRFHGGETNE